MRGQEGEAASGGRTCSSSKWCGHLCGTQCFVCSEPVSKHAKRLLCKGASGQHSGLKGHLSPVHPLETPASGPSRLLLPPFLPQGHFPEAKLDPVIQIASLLTVQGQDTPVVRNVMTLGSCASIVGAEVMSFEA